MRLINADKLLEGEHFILKCKSEFGITEMDVFRREVIENAPTVENNEYNRGFMHAMIMVGKEAEERPQGKWIYGNLDYSTCSNCMYSNHYGDFPFCPNCGADMRKEKK
jgi:hypothetical protein